MPAPRDGSGAAHSATGLQLPACPSRSPRRLHHVPECPSGNEAPYHPIRCAITGEIIAMKLPQTGGCLCGKIRYEITEAPQLVYTCHCVDCQRLTNSAFSTGIVVPDTAFRLMGFEPRQLQRTAGSGRVNTRLVCPECGSWVCGMPRDGVRRVRAGTLGDKSGQRPTR